MSKPLQGQVAVVTGAARGLGQAVALELAGQGATIVALDLGPTDETVSAVKAAGGHAAGQRTDVTDETAVEARIDSIVGTHGRLDILINAAGRWIDVARRPFWEIDVPEFDAMMTVNVRSAFVVAKAASRPMREARAGSIVNFSSATVSFGMPDLIHYVAAKAALVGLTRSMARELGPYGVTANAVAPGLVPTDAGREVMTKEWYDAIMRSQVITKPITPQDIAAAVAYLCGPGGRMVTGETLHVSAGATMGGV
jgi:3-oxoacyl-[acyl-carrier protein] reductase